MHENATSKMDFKSYSF